MSRNPSSSIFAWIIFQPHHVGKESSVAGKDALGRSAHLEICALIVGKRDDLFELLARRPSGRNLDHLMKCATVRMRAAIAAVALSRIANAFSVSSYSTTLLPIFFAFSVITVFAF